MSSNGDELLEKSFLQIDHMGKEIKDLEKELSREKERSRALVEFAEHSRNCIRTFQEAGRPTADGGYETMFKGVWYQSKPVNKEPECNCGLKEALRAFEENKDHIVESNEMTKGKPSAKEEPKP